MPKRDESGYIEVWQQRAGSLNIKKLLLIKGNKISIIKEFRAFFNIQEDARVCVH